MSRRKQSRGKCTYCERELAKGGMLRHLATCPARRRVIAALRHPAGQQGVSLPPARTGCLAGRFLAGPGGVRLGHLAGTGRLPAGHLAGVLRTLESVLLWW